MSCSIGCMDEEIRGGVAQAKENIWNRKGSSQKAALPCLEDNLGKFFH